MKIDFEPIMSIRDFEEVLAIIEIKTFFYGTTYVSDLEWDEESLLSSFLEAFPDGPDRQDFEAEPAAGILEAKGRFLSELYKLIEERHNGLALHSPFTWDFGNGLLLAQKEKSALTTISIGYLWLSFYALIQSEKNYLVIHKDDIAKFRGLFAPVFEHICCFAITGRASVKTWYLGDSRDVSVFLQRLARIVDACGSGKVKGKGDLEANQTGANDGGVDLIAIELQNGNIRRDAIAYLVGATLQRSNRRPKIMGIPEVGRFTGYFSAEPVLAYQGILAVPFPRSEIEELNCRDEGCLYMAWEDLLFYLGRIPQGNGVGHLRRPATKLLRATETLASTLIIEDNGGGRSLAAATCSVAA